MGIINASYFPTDDQPVDVSFNNLQAVTLRPEEVPKYNGAYSVVPTLEAQVLDTKLTMVSDNITVAPIPYREEINERGTTVIIGG